MAAIERASGPRRRGRTFYRRVGGEGPPAVFVHGNPTHSEDWLRSCARLEGPAIALDLPGWGFSERPTADRFDYSMRRPRRASSSASSTRSGSSEHSLVVHDWGAVALIAAQRRPERVGGWS